MAAKEKAMRIVGLALGLVLLTTGSVGAGEWKKVDEAIAALDAAIGSYPPQLENKEQRSAVLSKYKRTKATLDAALATRPDDIDNLLRRARLQVMGHNLDLPGAFSGAERDFFAILNLNPEHERAILDLANLWVNSSPHNAPRAEMLYRAAQCLHDATPLEEAQRGLFFAFYYQGRFEDAKRQAEFLTHQWPGHEIYQSFAEMAAAVVVREGKAAQAASPPTMTACG